MSRTWDLVRSVLELKCRGLSDREAAERLGISRTRVCYLRRIARERWGIEIPKWKRAMEPDDIVYAIVVVLARRNGGEVRAGEVYEMYRLGAELGYWEPRSDRALNNAIKRLVKAGLVEREVRSFGRYGATSILKPVEVKETLYTVIIEELLLS